MIASQALPSMLAREQSSQRLERTGGDERITVDRRFGRPLNRGRSTDLVVGGLER
jgi:hypothetical protein